MPLTIMSPAFPHVGSIPSLCTCEGSDTSPALSWSGAPAGTASFALIVHDPDAPDPAKPQRDYVHWVLYDIPPSADGLAEGMTSRALPPGTRSSSGRRGTRGSRCTP